MLKDVEKQLKENSNAVIEGVRLYLKDGKVYAQPVEKTGKVTCRPSVWGSVDDDKNIHWLHSEDALKKRVKINSNIVKTTVGTHVTGEEYVEITRLAELLGISRSQFCRDAILAKVEEVKSKIKL